MTKPKYPSKPEIEELYANRERVVAALGQQAVITASELSVLDYQGRCKVANEHWAICSGEAKQALLADSHHFVRSCAALAGKEESMQYSEWEQAVTECIAHALKIPFSDAASVVEAQQFFLQQSWGLALNAEQTATKILASGICYSNS